MTKYKKKHACMSSYPSCYRRYYILQTVHKDAKLMIVQL